MKKLLILTGYYWPGCKGGGPIQSCINMVENLSDYYDIYVICSDRDKDDTVPYANIKINCWMQVGKAKVYYIAQDDRNLRGFEKAISSVKFDAIYLNGFFAPLFTQKPLLLKRFGRLQKAKYILTPRGDFTGGCENKKFKKYMYIYLTKVIGLYKNLLWHATSELEKEDILKVYPKAPVVVAPNLPAKYVQKEISLEKTAGRLRLIFVSRIFPKKNLKYALEVLKGIKTGDIDFDIYGPMEDKNYWHECEGVIAQMPANVTVNYKGELPHEKIGDTFSQYHAFLFPTLGENYGHVIVESMMNNCLCILSRGVTPWDDNEKHGGFVCNLDKRNEFETSIAKLVAMDDIQWKENVKKTQKFIHDSVNPKEIIEQYCEILG